MKTTIKRLRLRIWFVLIKEKKLGGKDVSFWKLPILKIQTGQGTSQLTQGTSKDVPKKCRKVQQKKKEYPKTHRQLRSSKPKYLPKSWDSVLSDSSASLMNFWRYPWNFQESSGNLIAIVTLQEVPRTFRKLPSKFKEYPVMFTKLLNNYYDFDSIFEFSLREVLTYSLNKRKWSLLSYHRLCSVSVWNLL